MSVNLWLTGEQSDVDGYLRMTIGSKSSCPSMLRSSTGTVNGPTAGLILGTWISDPLSDAVALTAKTWQMNVWANQSDVNLHAALRFQIWRWSEAGGEDTLILDDTSGAELSVVRRSSGRTTVTATGTDLVFGDRLVLKLLADDASLVGNMVAGGTVSISYDGQRAGVEGNSYIVCPDNIQLAADVPPETLLDMRVQIQDESASAKLLSDDNLKLAFRQALREYSKDRPYVETDFWSGDGQTRLFPMPRRWILGFSSMQEVEYPVESNVSERNLLEIDDWELVSDFLGPQPTRQFRFKALAPDQGTSNVLVRYTTSHLHTTLESTIPLEDYDAVILLAASYACLQMATRAAGASDPTIAADAVQHRDETARWQALAKELRTRYTDRFRKSDATTLAPASVTRDWDIHTSVPGEPFLFKSSRWR